MKLLGRAFLQNGHSTDWGTDVGRAYPGGRISRWRSRSAKGKDGWRATHQSTSKLKSDMSSIKALTKPTQRKPTRRPGRGRVFGSITEAIGDTPIVQLHRLPE